MRPKMQNKIAPLRHNPIRFTMNQFLKHFKISVKQLNMLQFLVRRRERFKIKSSLFLSPPPHPLLCNKANKNLNVFVVLCIEYETKQIL